MCWNKEVSLNTFIFSTLSLLFIYYNNTYTQYKLKEFTNIYIYILFLSFIGMQLLEYYIWDNIENKNINKNLSIIALILILSQPLFSILLINNNKTKNTLLTYYTLFVSLIILIYMTTNKNMSTDISKNGHLKWNWLPRKENTLFVILWSFYFIFLLYPLYIEKNYTTLTFFTIVLLISLFTYLKYRTYESMWCWLSNFIMFIFLFQLLIYLPYNQKSCL